MKIKKMKQHPKPFLLTLLLCLTLVIQTTAPVAMAAQKGYLAQQAVPADIDVEQESLEEQMEFLEKLIRVVDTLYYEEVDLQQYIDGAYKGVFDVLDPYSVYYTDEEYQEFDIQVTGTFGGIGVQIAMREGYITVVAPIYGTPAHRAGIKAGDRVVSIDDTDVREISIDKVATMMRGEPGTQVKIGVIREGSPSVIDFEITREIIEVNPVTHEVLDQDIGYIRLIEFNEHASENVNLALDHFDQLGIKDIIMDLRDNPGGIIDQAVKVAGRFVPEGPVVHVDRRTAPRQTFRSGQKQPKYNLAVLVNGGSASASEIVAGAVQDTAAGVLIGTQTFGKGTVQQILPLSNGAKVKLTIAKYLTPSGRAIDGEGITPDIVVENPDPEGEYGQQLVPINGDRKLEPNTVGLDVLGVEQRLDTMGYTVGQVDGVFDDALQQAVKEFQSDSGLYPYGDIDLTTQQQLLVEYQLYIEQNAPDVQLQKAIEHLKSN